MLLFYINYLKLILYIYLIMDAEFIPQEQVSLEQKYIDYIFKNIVFLGKVEQDLKSKNLCRVLLHLCLYYEDTDLFELQHLDKFSSPTLNKYDKLLCKYDSETRRLRLILFRLRTKILETLYRKSKKYLMSCYFHRFHYQYELDKKINVGDIIIYKKKWKCLCVVKNITSKNYVLKVIYTNAKTYRKNLYGEENFKYAKSIDGNFTPQYKLFTKIYFDKQHFNCSREKIKNKVNYLENFEKIYKNNEGIYCGRDLIQANDFLTCIF